jgi:lipopolysaccharide biosynthesis regulator YciM
MEGANFTFILLYLLLLAALALGWWLGRRSNLTDDKRRRAGKSPSKDYFIGLNYLLNDEPDDAIDIFIDSLEINSSTLQTHMALGTLLRRRGKVDRSIAVYHDLLGRGGFSADELQEIKINLVQSYISAGLLDRAEHLLGELRKEKGNIKIKALIQSAHVYQLERDWEKGIQALTELLKVCSPTKRQEYQHLSSHFYCELAEQELDGERMSRAREYLQEAISMDKANVRVSILRGKLEAQCGNYDKAIKFYLQVRKQDPAFMADVFSPLLACYGKAGKEKELNKFIKSCREDDSNATVLLGLAGFLEKEEGNHAAMSFLLRKLESKSSLRLLQRALGLQESDGTPAIREFALYQRVLNDYIDSKAQYRCQNCGFEMKTLHWHCPSCSHWGSVKHLIGILGE